MKPWQAVTIMLIILTLMITVGPIIAMVKGLWHL